MIFFVFGVFFFFCSFWSAPFILFLVFGFSSFFCLSLESWPSPFYGFFGLSFLVLKLPMNIYIFTSPSLPCILPWSPRW
ncbi:hypothetical protein [Marmot herpesvirus 1]|nr:hypothetical protein [Marmot herpesvirus 1]